MLGPVDVYSTRSKKRTIKKFSNLIAGKTKTGIDTSNLLFKITNYNSNLIEKLGKNTRRLDMTDTYDTTDSMSRIPSGSKDAPQLWELVNKEEECIDSDNREILHGVPGSQVELALKSYYTRLFKNTSNVVENRKIKFSFCLWLDSIVYSSLLYR
jgi:hypothetical protein